MIDRGSANVFAALLSAMAEPNRLRILWALRNSSRSVTELSQLTENSIVNVSHHLGIMKTSGILDAVKVGRSVIYSLNPAYFVTEDTKVFFNTKWCKMELLENTSELQR